MKLLPAADTHAEWRARYAHRKKIVVTDEETCSQALHTLQRALDEGVEGFGVDTETDTVERMKVLPITAQFSFDHTDVMFGPEFIHEVKPIIDQRPTMLGFESKFELWAFENAGMPWLGEVRDAQIVDYLVNENIKDYDLKTRCAAVFKEPRRPDYKHLYKNKRASELWENPEERPLFIDYSCADSADHVRLHENRAEELRKWPLREDGSNMYDDFYLKTETTLTRMLYEMERVGALVDVELLEELHDLAQDTIEQLQRKFYREIDFEKLPKATKKAIKGEFSGFSEKLLNSPKQLMYLFYTVMDCPEQYHMVKDKKTGKKSRKLTTNDDALETLAAEGYTAAALLRDIRAVDKLDGTYAEGLIKHADFLHYVHTNFMQAFTTTGRLSSRDPNLQNLPRSDEEEDMPEYLRRIRLGIRGAFIAPKGYVLVGGDYGQIETRLMAHLSGDKDMIRACMESDIYSAMAAILFHKPLAFFAKVQGEMSKEAKRIRQIVKAIVLGIGFGKQAKSIARDLRISVKEAERFLKMYFARFPVFYAWMRKTIRKARRRGFVRTMTGRYRRLPDLSLPNITDNWWKISTAERQALNAPVQGSAWEIMKQTMLNVRSSGILKEYGAKMFHTVHDELLTYVPKEEAEAFKPKFQEIALHPFRQDLKVPLVFETYSALTWAEGK